MISPSDIKAGAQFVVTVELDDIRHGFVVIGRGYESTHVPISILSPLPTPSLTAAIDAEIMEAAMAHVENTTYASAERLFNVVRRRRAMSKPKDAVGGIATLLDKIATDAREMRDMAEALAARVRKERGE